MTQEEKELLFQDLSTRLPYHVKVKVWLKDGTYEEGKLDLEHNYGDVLQDAFYYNNIIGIKPYLRPMSSMTEDERNEYFNIIKNTIDFYNCPKSEDICFLIIPIDWLNAHHFDYRGLIEKGLALEAPKEMYNIKER